MTRIRYRSISSWATLLVFGMLGARALVPAGFMLAPVDGHLAFVLCEPGVMAAGDPHQHQHPHPHEHEHHHPGNDLAAHHDGAHSDPCPYAQSAGPAPLPTLPVLTAGPIPNRVSAPAEAQTRLTFGPPRQQTSRGPPSLV